MNRRAISIPKRSKILALSTAEVRASGAAAMIVTHSDRAAAIADREFVLGPQG